MKESISYAFLINIIIIFIFICFAIIMGIFSYYKAFRANTIITSAIEKYEGYNCASINEIERKLQGISYNVPFKVKCKSGDENCIEGPNGNYKITAYNLDGPTEGKKIGPKTGEKYENITITGSIYNSSTNKQTRNYQYGVTTYMYVDAPVINELIKISFFSKTDILYEFRELSESLDGNVFDYKYKDTEIGAWQNMLSEIMKIYSLNSTGGTISADFLHSINDSEYNARRRSKYDINGDGLIDPNDHTAISGFYDSLSKRYRNCEEIRSFDNY